MGALPGVLVTIFTTQGGAAMRHGLALKGQAYHYFSNSNSMDSKGVVCLYS